MDAYLAPLEKILAGAKDLTARLDMRLGVKQQETRDRRALIQAGNVQVSRIRSAIKAFFGPNSERVIELGARPLRPRTGKVKQAKAEPPAVSQPGTSAAPSSRTALASIREESPGGAGALDRSGSVSPTA
jgi:hypothetical protein